MKIFKIKIHSFIDLITNSSTEIYTLDSSKSVDMVKMLLEHKCDETGDLDWYEEEVSVYSDDDNSDNAVVVLRSFLNSPDWFDDFVRENFTVLDYDHS